MRHPERQSYGLLLASPCCLGKIIGLPALMLREARASLRGRREVTSRWGAKAGRCNLYRALGAVRSCVQDVMRSRPNLVPAGHGSPAANSGRSLVRLRGGGCHDLVAAPTELAVRPHAVHDHRELARNRYCRAAQAAALGDSHTPGFQCRPSGNTG
jgi:hypothetical protein